MLGSVRNSPRGDGFHEFEDATGAGPVPRPDKNKLLRGSDSEIGLGKTP